MAHDLTGAALSHGVNSLDERVCVQDHTLTGVGDFIDWHGGHGLKVPQVVVEPRVDVIGPGRGCFPFRVIIPYLVSERCQQIPIQEKHLILVSDDNDFR